MSPEKEVNLKRVVCKEELWPNYFKRFVARYAEGPRWPDFLVALLWIAKRFKNDIRYLDLDLSAPSNIEKEIADVWNSGAVFPKGHKKNRFNDTFEHRWCKAVQEIRESIKQGELSCDSDGISRVDAVRWLRGKGVEVDPTVPDAAPAAARDTENQKEASSRARTSRERGRPKTYAVKELDRLSDMWADFRNRGGRSKADFVRECMNDIPKCFKPETEANVNYDEALAIVEEKVSNALEAKRKRIARTR